MANEYVLQTWTNYKSRVSIGNAAGTDNNIALSRAVE